MIFRQGRITEALESLAEGQKRIERELKGQRKQVRKRGERLARIEGSLHAPAAISGVVRRCSNCGSAQTGEDEPSQD